MDVVTAFLTGKLEEKTSTWESFDGDQDVNRTKTICKLLIAVHGLKLEASTKKVESLSIPVPERHWL